LKLQGEIIYFLSISIWLFQCLKLFYNSRLTGLNQSNILEKQSDGVFDGYKEYLGERPELVPFKANLSDNEIWNLRNFVNSLNK